MRRRGGGRIDHNGISIELSGTIDDLTLAGRCRTFLASSLILTPDGNQSTPSELLQLPFSFGALSLPHASFEGARLQIRYFLRVTVKRSMADRTFERTLWVEPIPSKKLADSDMNNENITRARLEVGLDSMMSLSIELDDGPYTWLGLLRGRLLFTSLSISLVSADLCIIRREYIPAPKEPPTTAFQVPEPSEFISRFQILEGPVRTGDEIPFRFHLASCLSEHSVPTCSEEHGLYAVRYYAFFELQDSQQRRFYKAHEIVIE